VLLLRNTSGNTLLLVGTTALSIGAALTVVSVRDGSTVLFYVSSTIAGVGFGSGFQGAIRTVFPLAAPDERAGLASALYLISYLAFGAPAVLAGFLVTRAGLHTTAEVYGSAVAVLALAALAATAWELRRTTAAKPKAECPRVAEPAPNA
jgi:MFS family permease